MTITEQQYNAVVNGLTTQLDLAKEKLFDTVKQIGSDKGNLARLKAEYDQVFDRTINQRIDIEKLTEDLSISNKRLDEAYKENSKIFEALRECGVVLASRNPMTFRKT